VWELDQVINDRGVRIDRRSCIAAIRLVDKAKAALDAEMAAITGGAVTACTQVAKLTAWVRAQGMAIDSLAKDEVIDTLEFIDVPDAVRRALLTRQEAAKTSTEKLKGFLKHLCADDHVRGVFNYHATRPGRWSSGGGVNLGNMPRPRAIYNKAKIDAATLFGAIRTENPTFVRELYGPVLGRPLNLISDAIRGFLWASPNHDFIAVDYSGIQGAIGAWLAGETWKLTAMREILADPDNLPDMYRRAAAGILNTTTDIIDKDHPMRQAVGKTSELALLFSGGVVALVKMAKNYGMKLRDFHDLYPAISDATDEDLREKVAKRWERATKGRDKFMSNIMSREAWMACDLIKFGWRARNPAQTRAWETLEETTLEAMRDPGRQLTALKATYLYTRGALWCRLPSGRPICYSAPRLHDQVWAKIKLEDGSWTTEAEVLDRVEAEKLERRGDAKIEGATRQRLTALGVDPQSQKLVRKALYGGKHMQNLCLGIESDILRVGMRNLEDAGYEVRLHNYDEAVAEVPRGSGSVAEAERLMLTLPAIYADLPLGAHGWRGKRYRKG
jgi:DNA polymerase